MTVEALKSAIAALPAHERYSLVTRLNEFEFDSWDKQMPRDSSLGVKGMALVEMVKADVGA